MSLGLSGEKIKEKAASKLAITTRQPCGRLSIVFSWTQYHVQHSEISVVVVVELVAEVVKVVGVVEVVVMEMVEVVEAVVVKVVMVVVKVVEVVVVVEVVEVVEVVVWRRCRKESGNTRSKWADWVRRLENRLSSNWKLEEENRKGEEVPGNGVIKGGRNKDEKKTVGMLETKMGR